MSAATVPDRRGRFLVLEGIDGAGTTTQARLLAAWLQARHETVHVTREPSDGPVGVLIRQVLGGRVVAAPPGGVPAVPVRGETVALLFAADRLDHVQCEVTPLLARGVHVLSDRYVLSSLAYQSLEAPLAWVRELNRLAAPPDLTILLRVRPDVALGRIASTRVGTDRFERLDLLTRVAATYDELMAELPPAQRLVVDGEQPVAAVAAEIAAAVGRLLPA